MTVCFFKECGNIVYTKEFDDIVKVLNFSDGDVKVYRDMFTKDSDIIKSEAFDYYYVLEDD